METKQYCSSIVHMKKRDMIYLPIMKEVFFILLNRTKNNKCASQFNMNIKEMTNIMFEDKNEEQENEMNESNSKNDELSEEEELNNSNIEENEVSDSNSSFNDEEDERIKKLISESNNNIKIIDLQKMLKEKIDIKEKGIQDIKGNAKQIINTYFFYNLWKASFLKESYKSSMNYQKFIKRNFIKSPEEMNETLNRLLSGYYINFLDEDPSKFSTKIDYTIFAYNIN